MSLREIDQRLVQLRGVLAEGHCTACGGWDKEQGGRGHKSRCPLGAAGTEIGSRDTSATGLGVVDPFARLNTLISDAVWGVVENHIGAPGNTPVYQLASSAPDLAVIYAFRSNPTPHHVPTKANLIELGAILKRAGYRSNADFEKDDPQGATEFIRRINDAARFLQQSWQGDESHPGFKEEMKNFKAGLKLLGVDPSKIKFDGYDWGFYAA